MKDKTKRRPRQEPTLVEAGGGTDAPEVAASSARPDAPADVEAYPAFRAEDESPVVTAHSLPYEPPAAATWPDPSFDPIGPVQPDPVDPSREDLLWAEPGLQPGPLHSASGERDIHAGPLEPSQTGDIHPGPLQPAPDSDIHVGPLEPAYESEIRVGPLDHAATDDAPPQGGDVHLLAEDRAVPSAAALAPAIVRRKKGWREQRWERRRRRIFFEEALAWVLVPIILVGCYLGVKGVLAALGTTPTALIQGIQTAISSRS